jgi:hypothetical protein
VKSSVKILFFVLFSPIAFGQIPAEEQVDYLYKKHWYGGSSISTNGLGFEGGLERNLSFKKHLFVTAYMGNLKNDKEIRRKNPIHENSKSYVFGKINSIVLSRLSIGYSYLLYEQRRKRGVSIQFKSSIGASYAWIKPIYVKIKEPSIENIKKPFDERYNPEIHFPEIVFGRSSFFKGFNEGIGELGIHGRTGLAFDVSQKKNRILMVELGIQIDAYRKEIPVFYTGTNKKLYPGMYATVLLGINKF